MSRSSVGIFLTQIWKRRWLRPQASRARLFSRWTVTGSYLILALGIPLPVPMRKKSGQPYPCMNHACGCQSAEECWRHCCCMTLEERLTWARENHVRPPDYALAEARAEGIEWAANWPSEPSQQNENQWACFQPTNEHAACEPPAGQCPCCKPAANECPCCACQSCTNSRTCKESQPISGVLLIEALKCHGVGENWQGLVISLAPPPMIQVRFPNEIFELVNLSATTVSSISFPPDVPPPRLLFRGLFG
jgi:hypothetical protein